MNTETGYNFTQQKLDSIHVYYNKQNKMSNYDRNRLKTAYTGSNQPMYDSFILNLRHFI